MTIHMTRARRRALAPLSWWALPAWTAPAMLLGCLLVALVEGGS